MSHPIVLRLSWILTCTLVSSCSRGIGLELAKQLLESPSNFIIGTVRDPVKATALQALKETARGTLEVIQLDVDDPNGIERSVEEVTTILGERGLDYLINNAAIVRPTSLPRSLPLSLSLSIPPRVPPVRYLT